MEQPARAINLHIPEHSTETRTLNVILSEIQRDTRCGKAGPLNCRYYSFCQQVELDKREIKYLGQGHDTPPGVELTTYNLQQNIPNR